jgi:hypothetical protein
LQHSRSPTFALLSKAFNDVQHLLATAIAIDHLASHAHGHLFACVSAEKTLDEQMAHEQAHKDAAVAAVFLLRRVLKVDEAQRALQHLSHLPGGQIRLGVVGAAKGIIVEGKVVALGNEQQRPVAAALGHADVSVVVDGHEDVRDLVEVGQGVADLAHIGLLHEEERHAGPQENDARLRVAG